MGTTRYSYQVAPGVTRIWYERDATLSETLIAGAIVLTAAAIPPWLAHIFIMPWMHSTGYYILDWVFFAVRILIMAALVIAAVARLRDDSHEVGAWFGALLPIVITFPYLILATYVQLAYNADSPYERYTYEPTNMLAVMTFGLVVLFALISLIGVIFGSGRRLVFLAGFVGFVILAIFNMFHENAVVPIGHAVTVMLAVFTFISFEKIAEGWRE